MNIQEENYNIQYPNIKMLTDYDLCDDFETPFKNFKNNFALAILGPASSGKTTKLIQLFNKNHKDNKNRCSFYGLFHNIVICSPSLHTIGDDNIFNELPDENIYNEFNEDFLEKYNAMMDLQKQEYDEEINTLLNLEIKKKAKQNKKTVQEYINTLTDVQIKNLKKNVQEHVIKPFNCLILDDIGNDIRGNKELTKQFKRLICNRRHKGVCGTAIILLLQNLKMMEPKVRNNISHILTFNPNGDEERKDIYTYTGLPKKHMEDFYNKIFIDGRDTLLIDKSRINVAHSILYKNFNKLILS